ncbi:hypothetical protein IE4803_CH02584 [Rhizobium etli bv. phaseoli str. IE4803]|nr:hypothetical protein IE4803_CH02584 [Rhizobium etli bv. phaseoli str. IE4803]
MLIILAVLIGVVAGLRAMTAPTALTWGAYLGWFPVTGTALAFMGSIWAVVIFTILAIAELVSDQLPSTPSRKVPIQFGARIIMGALAGATISAAGSSLIVGLISGVAGAVVGTYGGAAARSKLAQRFGRDLPAALIEDAIAIGLAILIAMAVS